MVGLLETTGEDDHQVEIASDGSITVVQLLSVKNTVWSHDKWLARAAWRSELAREIEF